MQGVIGMSKSGDWKNVMSEIFSTCQDELKRTTEIGKKMISASRMNSTLNETYQELGKLAVESLRDGKLDWDDPEVEELLKKIAQCEKDIEDIEGDVYKIKFPEPTGSKDKNKQS